MNSPPDEQLEAFARFCDTTLTAEDGSPLHLHDFQRTMLTDLFGGVRETLILISKKNGKALALDTPVATPGGWTTMGDIQVGDLVFGGDGKPTEVIAATEAMADRPCFQVVFGGGETIVADAEHLWLTDDRLGGGFGVRSTKQIAATLVDPRNKDAARHRVPLAGPLDLPDVDLPVDPYTLGAWLGDGHTDCGRITNQDSEVWANVAYPTGSPPPSSTLTRTVLGLKPRLRQAGVLGDKHVPGEYLRAGHRQRLALLRGLMDTDGTMSARGLCEFTTTKIKLVAGVAELITTLGWKPSIQQGVAKLDGRTIGPKWTIQFTAYRDVPVFTIPRKIARQKPVPASRTRSQVRAVIAATPVPSVPVRCIEVAADDGLFLAGQAMVPTHNSTLLGALALFHLCSTPDAECVIAAASRDQAGIMLRQAAGFIRRAPGLQERLQVKQREIVHKTLGGRIRILASDVDTADGVIPTLALVDELHRHKTADLYGIFRDGLGPRNGRMVTISTAGDDEDSPLGQLRRAAHELPGMKKDGAYSYVSSPGFVMHEWALEASDDLDDLKLVKQANPAPWQSIKALGDRKGSASMLGWQWARFACGVWAAGEDGAFSEKEWRACADPDAKIPDGAPGVIVGIDLGWKWDTTAIVPLLAGPDQITVHPPTILVPPRDGTSLDAEDIWDVIEDMAERWPGMMVVIDPEADGEQLAQRIHRELDVEVITHSQKPSPMALAAQRLSAAIGSHRLHQPDHHGLTQHVLAAAAKPVGEGWRLVKSRRSKKPIDAAVALAMAVSIATAPDEPFDPNSYRIELI